MHLLSKRFAYSNSINHNFWIAGCNLGKGLFAKRHINKGEEILRFTGDIIDFNQALAREINQADALQIGNNLYINLEDPGRFVNHSCNPNAGIRNDVVLVALQDIGKGEQVYYDYSATMDEDNWVMQCRCGSANCRKIVKDFKYLPSQVKQKYLDLRVVQRFIAIQYQQSAAGKKKAMVC